MNSSNIDTCNSIRRSRALRRFLLVPLALTCFVLSPTAQAVSPAPDGGYANNNTAEGNGALFSLTSGENNTAIGTDALFDNTTGNANTATGEAALRDNTTGGDNTATGFAALNGNTTGNNNTANGFDALIDNITGDDNTAIGYSALFSNTTGGSNTAIGSSALYYNTTGGANTANGIKALYSNTTGFSNTADGAGALHSNTTGAFNTAMGGAALSSNTTGTGNTATGFFALSNATSGGNTANGYQALFGDTTGFFNTADGIGALLRNTTGSHNIAFGDGAGDLLTTGDNNIDIGNEGVAAEANTIRIGKVGTQTATYVAGIMGKTVPMSTPVFVNANGQLGTTTSSARFKDQIKPMDKASEAILVLKPVTFRYKKEIDPDSGPQFGLVAEEVEKVNADLVVRDPDGKPYTVRYEAVNAMLLNEFLKEHHRVKELETTITELKKEMETLVACIKGQDSKIQRVTDYLEITKPIRKVVLNNQ
jgi:trimeric autotransporter adhesin